MNHYSPQYKSTKSDNNTHSPRILKSSMYTIDNALMQNGCDKIIKLESVSSQQLKRRRSRSHNLMDYADGDIFNNNQNNAPFSSQNHPVYANNQWIKDKHKKDTHNRVERKRRDFINGQIQRLAELLPSEFFMNYDLKMNKGIILKNSVEYISSLRCVEEINRKLELETELGSKLIRFLVALKDLNCSDLSLDDVANDPSSGEDININNLISEWQCIHQENKELMQQFSNTLCTTFSESKKDISFENMPSLDVINNNNNSVLISPPPRKRYSSMPTNIGTDCPVSQNLPIIKILDPGTSPILNSLLKKPDQSYRLLKNDEPTPTTFFDDNYYLPCTSSLLADDDLGADTATVLGQSDVPNLNKEEKYFRVKDKMYYILPKSVKSQFKVHNKDSVMAHDTDEHTNDNNNSLDPMLLSDNMNFDIADH